MNGAFELHPEAARDITEIWEYIAEDSPTAAGRVREEIRTPSAVWSLSLAKATGGQTSPEGRCAFGPYANT